MNRKNHTARNRQATRQHLIDTVGKMLARDGFKSLGINAIAKQAGVDKVLIYRYFNGLTGLIRAYGKEGNFWPSNQELCGGDVLAFYRLPVEERAITLMRNYIKAIRSRPVSQEILAWEMVERNELTAELEAIREQRAKELMPLLLDEHAPEPDPHSHVLSAIIGATVNYLASRSRHIQWFNGLNLSDESGWQQLEQTFEHLIRLHTNAE